jgi:hypothetical protein
MVGIPSKSQPEDDNPDWGDMSEPTQVKWRIAGEELASCNCDWGCPCQFNALPTTGRCEVFVTCLISNGYFGRTAGVVLMGCGGWLALSGRA